MATQLDTPKRTCLTLKDRLEVLKLSESGGLSRRQLAEKFKVGKTQIQTIITKKKSILEDANCKTAPDRKRGRVSNSSTNDINEFVWKWCQDEKRDQPITGPLLKKKALNYATEQGNTTFKASNGWLSSFLKRNNISLNGLSEGSGFSFKSICSKTDIEQLAATPLHSKIATKKSKTSHEQSTTSTPKKKVLTLSDRLKVLELSAGGISVKEIKKMFQVGKTQIQRIINQKNTILQDANLNTAPDRKVSRRIRNNDTKDINELVWKWCIDAKDRNETINGTILQRKALEIATGIGNTTFKASNGWLHCFLTRNNISFNRLSEGSGFSFKSICSKTDIEQLTATLLHSEIATKKSKTSHEQSTTATPKKKVLTLSDRLKVLELSAGGLSVKEIKKMFQVGKTQIQCIINQKNTILQDANMNTAPDRKVSRRIRNNDTKDINELVWKWCIDAKDRNETINGTILQRKALEIATYIGNTTFKASNGWLQCFLTRNNVSILERRRLSLKSGCSDTVIKSVSASIACSNKIIKKHKTSHARTFMKTNRNVLPLKDRLEVLKLSASGNCSMRELAKQFKVGRTQILNIIHRKRQILEDVKLNIAPSRKKARVIHKEINQLVWKWCMEAIERHEIITGSQLKTKALEFAAEHGNTTFKASSGWLESFLKRNNFSLSQNNVLSHVDACSSTITKEPVENVSSLIYQSSQQRSEDNGAECCKNETKTVNSGYDPNNSLIIVGTTLYYNSTTNGCRLQTKKSTKELFREHVCVGVCSSMTGEKFQPFVVGNDTMGKGENIIINYQEGSMVPVKYVGCKQYSNPNSLFENEIFTEWLKFLDDQMCSHTRHVFVVTDKLSSLPCVELSNIKLHLLSPESTCSTSPVEKGIVVELKSEFQKQQLYHIRDTMDASCMSENGASNSIVNSIGIDLVLYWLSLSWEALKTSTIGQCFHKSGLQDSGVDDDISLSMTCEDETQENIPLELDALSHQYFNCSFRELLENDNNSVNTETEAIADPNHLPHGQSQVSMATDATGSDLISESVNERSVSISDCREAVQTLMKFSRQNGYNNLLETALVSETELNKIALVMDIKQETAD